MNYTKLEAKEASKAQIHGLWAAITTPFTPDGDLDEAGLRHNMRHFTNVLHIDGIFCTGNMGEFWALTKEERRRAVEIVVEEARGKCRVIAHTAHHSARETVDLTLHAQNVGADFVIFINPYLPAMSEDGVFDWFEYISKRVDIGIWMFDSSYAGYGLSPELTARIGGLTNVCGVKVGRPLEHYAEVHRLTQGSIVLSHPSEGLWLRLMRDYGQQVHNSSATPFAFQTATSQPLREYTELGLAGKFEQAERRSADMDPIRQLWHKWQSQPWDERRIVPIAYLKYWCELLGMAGGPVREPLQQLTDAERAEIRADLERVGLLGGATPSPVATGEGRGEGATLSASVR
ncbi:MAG TPA: dihydrodipicolinate synthase family protein [Chloroflexota bacterium]